MAESKASITIEAIDNTQKALADAQKGLSGLSEAGIKANNSFGKLNNALGRLNNAFMSGNMSAESLTLSLVSLGGKFSVIGGLITGATFAVWKYVQSIQQAKLDTMSFANSLAVSAKDLEAAKAKFIGIGGDKNSFGSVVAPLKERFSDEKFSEMFSALGVDTSKGFVESFTASLDAMLHMKSTESNNAIIKALLGDQGAQTIFKMQAELDLNVKSNEDKRRLAGQIDSTFSGTTAFETNNTIKERTVEISKDVADSAIAASKATKEYSAEVVASIAADKEAANARALQQQAFRQQITDLSLARQKLEISQGDMLTGQLDAYNQLLQIQNENLANIDKLGDTSAWIQQQNAINDTQQKIVDLNNQLLEVNGTFSQGFKSGLSDITQNTLSTFQVGKQAADITARGMSQGFQSFFFDIMNGKIKSLKDGFKSLLSMVSSIMSQIASMMATKAIMSLIGGLAGAGSGIGGGASAGGGGSTGGVPILVHTGGYIRRFHAGGLAGDEMPAILQSGEFVMNRNAVSRLGVDKMAAINNGASTGVVVNMPLTVQLQAIDAESGVNFLKRNTGQIREMISDGVSRSQVYAQQIRGR